MIHHKFIRQRISDVSLLDLLVHHGVYDADATVYAEGQSHLLIHAVEVRICYLINKLTHANNPRLFPNWEAEEGSTRRSKEG